MKVQFPHYNHGFRIVSIALEKAVADDLDEDNLDFLYITDTQVTLYPDNSILTDDKTTISFFKEFTHNYDVWECWPDGRMHPCYNAASLENFFFVTGKCNSNCIMCPSPEIARRTGQTATLSELIEIARHIPDDVPHLTITGGEPFLMGPPIFDFLSFLKSKFEYTDFLILTNGRVFALPKYVNNLSDCMPRGTILAIPIHGACSEIHDAITQSKHSFRQTISGIRQLLSVGIRIEIRIIISQMNLSNFSDLVTMIISHFSAVEYISIIGMEMTGSAHVNRNLLWVPYHEIFQHIRPDILRLMESGINVKLYNFPLCTVTPGFRTLCEKSISPDKVRYAPVCSNCSMKSACGGAFAGTIKLLEPEFQPI